MTQKNSLVEHKAEEEEEEKKEEKEVEEEEDDIQDTRCGIGICKPKWLQRLATKEVYMVTYSLIGLTQGMFFSYTVSVISTIEKRFKLTSKQTGVMLSGNDISQVILCIILSYYGNYGHRPRWMGVGIMFAALSCFLAAIPHFVYGGGDDYATDVALTTSVVDDSLGMATLQTSEELCVPQLKDDESCKDAGKGSKESYLGPLILLFISQFTVGIAVSIFNSLGMAYLDDNINKKTTPLYYAISLMIRIFGPVFGFFLGGKCLSIWIDPAYDPKLTTKDPRWLGAWWLGFLFLGGGLVLFGGTMFLFPRKLPATVRREHKKVERLAAKDAKAGGNKGIDYFVSLAKTKRAEAKPSIRNLKKALRRLFTNKIWVGNLFGTVVFLLAISGYWTFKPKYLENQFRKSATEANFYTGMTSLVASSLGIGLSGAILRWVRPSPRFITGYSVFLSLLGCCTYISLIFIGCPKLDIVGPLQGSAISPCSVECGCSNRFSPVCAEDQATLYYSACYAGCSTVNDSESPVTYSDCRCIGNSSTPSLQHHVDFLNTFSVPEDDQDGGVVRRDSVVRGYCPELCDSFKSYLAIQIITKAILSTGRTGNIIIHLRSVADEDKGLALGTLTVFISLLAFIPAPMIMGAIVDSACLVWDKSCGVSGNCWLYDSDKFRIILHLVPAVLVFIAMFGDIVVFYYSRQLDLYGESDDVVEMEKSKGGTEESKPMDPTLSLDPNPEVSTLV